MDRIKRIAKAHTIYKDDDGNKIGGITTILNEVIAKPYLIKWANNLGLEGIDSNKYTDALSRVGTLAHAMVREALTGYAIEDIADYSDTERDLAYNSVIAFHNWRHTHKIDVILSEEPLISRLFNFGGTMDLYCKLDGVYTLIDFKTGSKIYDEYKIQLSALKELLEENGHKVEQTMIIRLGRTEDEGFEVETYSLKDLDEYFTNVFHHANEIYKFLHRNDKRKG
jgi:hypothetical protein